MTIKSFDINDYNNRKTNGSFLLTDTEELYDIFCQVLVSKEWWIFIASKIPEEMKKFLITMENTYYDPNGDRASL